MKAIQVWGTLLLLFGALVLTLVSDGSPQRSSLTEIKGPLRTLEKSTSKGGGLGSLRFSLASDPRYFSYHSAAGDIEGVWGALQQAGTAEVKILMDPTDSHTLPADERLLFSVLELSVGGKTVRHYPEVAQSLEANDLIGTFIGWVTSAIGALLWIIALLRRTPAA